MSLSHFRSPFSGYSVAFSPFHRNMLAVASSQYYGIAGNGRVTIFDMDRTASPMAEFLTRDGCFDVAWSEKHDHVIAAATGDGSVKIFSFSSSDSSRPLAALIGHSAETYSVNWNLFNRDLVCTASWDRTVRVWDMTTTQCINTMSHHSAIAYEAKWNPRSDHVIASVGGDGDLVIVDMREAKNVTRIHAHDNEILCLDWNKYRDFTIATGSVDRSIRVWDIRKNVGGPVNVLNGHDLAVRRLRFSPHSETLLASCSYDMTIKIWSIGERMSRSLIDTYDHHSEFAVGLDFSNFHRDVVASTGWDRMVAVWQVGSVRRPGVKQVPIVHDRRIRQAAA